MLEPVQGSDVPRGRIAALDIARGLALVAMFAYHFTWDLADFAVVVSSANKK